MVVLHMVPGAANFVEPDHTVHMILEIDSNEVEASTWGLNRIGADQRGRSGAGATVFVLDRCASFSQRFRGTCSVGARHDERFPEGVQQ